jgi:hypothetical protein
MPNINDNDWAVLLSRIRNGKCTPFLGAGVNDGYLPTGTRLAKTWAEQYDYPLADCNDLARVSQFIAVKTGDGMWPKEELLRLFRQGYKEQDFMSHDNPLAMLAEMPLPVYISTNYDDYMRKALLLKGKRPQVELCRWNKLVDKSESALGKGRFVPTADEPVIFHLHGHEDTPASLVLTEDDYLDFLVNISRQKKLLPPRIEEALTGSSLLFMGYRLADWDFRVLMHGLVSSTERALRRISISVQLPPELPDEEREKAQTYLETYFGEMQVRIFWGTAREFAGKLRQLWTEAHSAAAA